MRHQLAFFLITCITLAFCACNNATTTVSTTTDSTHLVVADTTHTPSSATISALDTATAGDPFTDTNMHATFFLSVADTGRDYFKLRALMLRVSNLTHAAIDTQGRYYNKKKDEIVLPEDDEDEIYAGEYFPRRFESSTLSLEYYGWYAKPSTEKNIAILAGIFSQQKSADSMTALIKPVAPKAFSIRVKIYTGCMH